MATSRGFAIAAAFGAFGLCATAGGSARAAIVADSLPYMGTPHWTDVHGLGSSITLANGVSTLTAGGTVMPVHFGYASVPGNVPAWSMSNYAVGNKLTLTAKFRALPGGPAATDWQAYAFDQMTYATMTFNPKSCAMQTCVPGVQLTFGKAGAPGIAEQLFVPIDTSVYQDYGFILKNGAVSYLVGNQVFNGKALLQPSAQARTMRVGDLIPGPGTGVGEMLITKVAFDNAPLTGAFTVLRPAVPEPASWAMMIVGVAMAGVALRGARGGERRALRYDPLTGADITGRASGRG